MSDATKAQAVDAIAKVVGTAATMVGQPVAATTAEAVGALVIDALTKGTLNRLVARAQAAAAAIDSEVAAELAARNRK